jgi:hypothetical protein
MMNETTVEKIDCDFQNNFSCENHEFKINNTQSFNWKDMSLNVVNFSLYLNEPEIEDLDDIENYTFSACALIEDKKTGKTATIILDENEPASLYWGHIESQEKGDDSVIQIDMKPAVFDEDGEKAYDENGGELSEIVAGLKLNSMFDAAIDEAKELDLVWESDEDDC